MKEETIVIDEDEVKNGEKGRRHFDFDFDFDVDSWIEEINVAAGELFRTLRALMTETAVRRIIIRDPAGNTLLEMPLVAGILGGVLFWPVAVAGLAAAALTNYSVLVERHGPPPAPQASDPKPKASAKAASKKAAPKKAAAKADPARCQGQTQAGAQCKRKPAEGSRFCAQHKSA